MTDRKLRIQVALGAVNNLTRPVSAAQKSSAALANQIKATRDRLKNLSTQAASFDRLTDSSRKTTAQVSEMQLKTRMMATALRLTENPTQKQTSALQKQRAALAQLQERQKSEVQQLNQLRAGFYQQGISISRSSRATDQISQRTAQYNRQLQAQEQQLKRLAGARDQYDKGQAARGKMLSAGVGATAAGAGMLYGASRFVQPGLEFDESMSKVQAVTRLGDGSDSLKMLRAEARRLGSATHFTATQASQGQQMLAMAGFTPDAIKAALPGVLNMALAGGMDLGESSDIGSNILSQFSLNAGEMDRVSDVLTGTFTRANTDLRQLGEAMVYSGPVAAKLGVDVETTAALLGKMADGGLKGSMAGTALRASLSRLASPTKAAQEALDELGVSAADSTGKMRPAEDILKDLYEKTKKYGQVAQVSFFKDIAGEEAFVGLQTMVKSAGDGSLDILIAQLRQAKGEAEKNAKVMTNNLRGDLKTLGSAWEDLGIEMEESVDSPLRKITQRITGLIRSFGEWTKAHPKLTRALAGTAIGVAIVTAGMGALLLAGAAVLGPIIALRLGFSMLSGSGVGGLLTKLPLLSGGLGKLLPSIKGISPALLSWRTSAAAASGGLSSLRSGLSSIGSGALSGMKSIGPALANMVQNPMAMVGRLGGMVQWLATSPLRLLGSLGGAVFSGIGTAIGLVFSPIGLLVAAIVGAGILIYQYWEPIKAFFGGFFTGLINGLQPVRQAFSALSPIFDGIGQAIGRVWDWFIQLLSPVQSSKAELEGATLAGKTFGEVVGAVINGLFWPVEQLAKGLGWLLEKLGAIPKAADAASGAVAAMQEPKKPVMYEWNPVQKKMVEKSWSWSDSASPAPLLPAPVAPPPPLPVPVTQPTEAVFDDYGTLLRIGKPGRKGQSGKESGAGTTNAEPAAAADAMREKLGDIVFKNVPDYLPLASPYQTIPAPAQPAGVLAQFRQSAGDMLTRAQSVLTPDTTFDQLSLAGAGASPTLANRPLAARRNSGPVTHEGDSYSITIEVKGSEAANIDEGKLVNLLYDKIAVLQRQKESRRRSTLTDRE